MFRTAVSKTAVRKQKDGQRFVFQQGADFSENADRSHIKTLSQSRHDAHERQHDDSK
jgi:hypothetical protein